MKKRQKTFSCKRKGYFTPEITWHGSVMTCCDICASQQTSTNEEFVEEDYSNQW